MQGWNHQFLFPELIAKEDLVARSSCPYRWQTCISVSDQGATIHAITQSLQRLQHMIAGLDMEAHWVDKLLSYLQRLQTTLPAQTPTDQFSQLYTLRKWLFWVPILLLKCRGIQSPAILVLAHFYTASVTLEPFFPDLGTSFCSALSMPALENIVQVATSIRSDYGLGSAWSEIKLLLKYHQQATCHHCSRTLQNTPSKALQMNQATYDFDSEPIYNTATSGHSLAHISPTPHHGPPKSAPASILCYPYIELLAPRTETSRTDYYISPYVAMPSLGAPANACTQGVQQTNNPI
jgi:hypothetical protein